MTSVEIEYCVPCGFLTRAIELQKVLLNTFGEALDRITLVTGDAGVFRVSIDGECIFDKDDDECEFEYNLEDITDAVREQLRTTP